ncbi:hypothetical protein J5N97_022507 [Dioscorea zingiberensis]|uniref:SWIM-type domain-containing protein n=1 Tax=Dioscorea zingiberensis TaxID=325984 RepID=A0A9D5HAY3_9LILI|nr:hypothetical protein J5N97_022507 [Dioscorea zingiberensis]
MVRGKVLAVCQSGGEFVTGRDGSMSYSGGEAHAIEVTGDMKISDFKAEISSMFNCRGDTFTIKYFLPNNKRTLITISNDKDLQRMVDFSAGSNTTDVYVLKKVEHRTSRSVVADSGTPTDATATLVTLDDAKRRKLCTTGWESMLNGVGQVFDGPKAFRDALHKYAIANSFLYKFIKNDGVRVTAECLAENCPWRVHASKSPAKQEFTIKKMNNTHTCRREIGKEGHRLASQRWVASVIKERLRESPNYRPREIANDLNREYGLNLKYAQAWRGKFVAKKELQNPHEEACNQLPWYCERIMETNPGSVATLRTTDNSKCHIFVAFHASLSGFEHGCRPLIFLDGFSLKANKHWKLLAATAVDGENNIFPVSFSVTEAETIEQWHWFLLQLKSALTMSRTITFVSNKQNGLEDAVAQVFEDSYHAYCVHQLTEDFKRQLDDTWTQELKDTVLDTFQRSIYACKAEEFNECIESLRAESKELAEWVLSAKPEFWSNSFFKGLRYGQYFSKCAETFNSWISIRYEPSVMQIVDIIRCKMMELMYTRRKSLDSWSETLTPLVNQRLEQEMTKARTLDVICTTGSVFEVRDDSINVVNIETWECTCRRWQINCLPCIHALAVIEQSNGCVYDYSSKYFTTEFFRSTYSLSINPIPDAGKPMCMDIVDMTASCPPRIHENGWST